MAKDRIWSRASGSDDDGLPVTYRLHSDDAFAEIQNDGKHYDIIFVDGWHTFFQAENDILNSIECLGDDGTLVVHDCNPPEESHTGESLSRPDDEWCGNVYQVLLSNCA